MRTSNLDCVVRNLRRVASGGLTDQELLNALVQRRDPVAFEVLLRRHGPMVLSVCRRVLQHEHDAEDAFQATFLVLIRKGNAIRKRESVASWLYGVAYRTARKALAMNSRRRQKELRAAAQARRPPTPSDDTSDFDAALRALPERCRIPVVLCELEGRSRKDAARELGIPEGTLSSRLATARKLLAKRLGQRGWTGMTLTPAAAIVPSLLAASTVRAAASVLSGQAAAVVVPAHVLVLCEGVVKAMFKNQLKAIVTAFLFVGTLGVGSATLTRSQWVSVPRVAAAERPSPAAKSVEQAAAELATAKAVLKKLEDEVAAARESVAQKEAVYQRARQQLGAKQKVSDAAQAVAGRFQYRVPVEIGSADFKQGARLDILEVWGTRPRIEVGGQYIVRGKYLLPAQESGTVYLYRTATDHNFSGPNLDLQQMTVKKGAGEFTLLHSMSGTGYLHVQLLSNTQKYDNLADVYFGTGDALWRKKE